MYMCMQVGGGGGGGGVIEEGIPPSTPSPQDCTMISLCICIIHVTDVYFSKPLMLLLIL